MFPAGEVEDCEECVGVAFVCVDFDGCAEEGLGENEVCEGAKVEQGVVDVEELAEEGFQAVKVDGGLRVEHFKGDIDFGEVLRWGIGELVNEGAVTCAPLTIPREVIR